MTELSKVSKSEVDSDNTHLLFLMPNLNPGGAEFVAVRLANGLVNRGYRVSFLIISGGGELEANLDERVDQIDLDCGRARYSIFAVFRALQRLKPSLVISTHGRTNIISGVLKLVCKSTIFMARQVNTPSADNESKRLAWFARRLYHKLDMIICQSDHMLEEVSRYYHVPDEKLIRIYNPLPLEEISEGLLKNNAPFRGNRETVVYCGRLSHQKGVDVLLKGYSEFLHQRAHSNAAPAPKLFIVGDGELRPELEALASSLDITDAVDFVGFRKDRFRYLKYADVVVSPSRWEGFPNALIESIACGTPVISSDCPGGVREIIQEDVNGWFVAVEDPSAISTALLRFFNNPNYFDEQIVRSSVAKLHSDLILDQYDNLIFASIKKSE